MKYFWPTCTPILCLKYILIRPNYRLVQSYPKRVIPKLSVHKILTAPNKTIPQLINNSFPFFSYLKELHNIILGHKITIYTDHKNPTYKKINIERVMCWRLILKDFDPELKYIKGENSVVSDALSRLDISDNQEILNISELYG